MTVPDEYRKTPEAVNRLSRMQYRVTQEDETEPAFHNKYWDNHDAGLYVDVVSGQPLFSSIQKFESGSGWPCFTEPIQPDAAHTRIDRSAGMARIEVRSTGARQPPRAPLRRRPRGSRRAAVLHQLRRPPVRPARSS